MKQKYRKQKKRGKYTKKIIEDYCVIDLKQQDYHGPMIRLLKLEF
ncbi:MAG: hypothetical protein ACLTNU_13455 [Coprobacillus cateniformis]